MTRSEEHFGVVQDRERVVVRRATGPAHPALAYSLVDVFFGSVSSKLGLDELLKFPFLLRTGRIRTPQRSPSRETLYEQHDVRKMLVLSLVVEGFDVDGLAVFDELWERIVESEIRNSSSFGFNDAVLHHARSNVADETVRSSNDQRDPRRSERLVEDHEILKGHLSRHHESERFEKGRISQQVARRPIQAPRADVGIHLGESSRDSLGPRRSHVGLLDEEVVGDVERGDDVGIDAGNFPHAGKDEILCRVSELWFSKRASLGRKRTLRVSDPVGPQLSKTILASDNRFWP